MHALLTPAVFLSSGVINGNAGYMTDIVNVLLTMRPRNLKSSEDVTLRLVRDMNEYSFTELFRLINY